MHTSTLAVLSAFAISSVAAQLSGNASTTRYYDGHMGACGCGTGDTLFPWQTNIGPDVYTAAGSQALFDLGETSGSTNCGGGCGSCYQLTSTGTSPSGSDQPGAEAGAQITVMLTNLCPADSNAEWCPGTGGENKHGYEYHFDLMSAGYANSAFWGDNVAVSFQQVDCPTEAVTDFSSCTCSASIATVQSTVGGGGASTVEAAAGSQMTGSTGTNTTAAGNAGGSTTSQTTLVTSPSVAEGSVGAGESSVVGGSSVAAGNSVVGEKAVAGASTPVAESPVAAGSGGVVPSGVAAPTGTWGTKKQKGCKNHKH